MQVLLCGDTSALQLYRLAPGQRVPTARCAAGRHIRVPHVQGELVTYTQRVYCYCIVVYIMFISGIE